MKNKISQQKLIGFITTGILISVVILGLIIEKNHSVKVVSYNEFLRLVQNKQVAEVSLNNSAQLKFELKNGESYYTDNPRKENLKEALLLSGIKVKESTQAVSSLQYIMSTTVIIGLMGFVFYNVKRSTPKGGAMKFQCQMIEADQLNVDFNHIAGNIEAKEQVRDMIDFIQKPEKYRKLGAKMPKGIMFYGPPGTGKTLMAKALAKEAKVPFFSVSGSDFMQLYVGVGASRVRELFQEARKHEKAVIFIDEIDAIGKKRSANVLQSHDEKDQTLNALLTEMSGFKDEEGIVVIAATNRLDTLDEALLRPGRFDRHIEIGYPDVSAREAIIQLYLKNRPVSDEVQSHEWAKQTVFFTGAMLENLINEAAIEAANQEAECIHNAHLETAFYTIIAGREKKDRSSISELDRQITAYHEAGHTLITKILCPDNRVTKVTIIPSTKGAGGFSMNVPKDKFYLNKQEMIHYIKISLAGRASEELIFGKEYITTGASNDIEKASEDLRAFLFKYGMDEEMGLINMAVLTGQESFIDAKCLEKSQAYMRQFYEETKKVLKEHEKTLQAIADALLEKETLNEKEIASFFV